MMTFQVSKSLIVVLFACLLQLTHSSSCPLTQGSAKKLLQSKSERRFQQYVTTRTTFKEIVTTTNRNSQMSLANKKVDIGNVMLPLTLVINVAFVYDDINEPTTAEIKYRLDERNMACAFLMNMMNNNSLAPKVYIRPVVLDVSGYQFDCNDYAILFVVKTRTEYNSQTVVQADTYKTFECIGKILTLRTSHSILSMLIQIRYAILARSFHARVKYEDLFIHPDTIGINLYTGSRARSIACDKYAHDYLLPCSYKTSALSAKVIVQQRRDNTIEYHCEQTGRAFNIFCYIPRLTPYSRPQYLTFYSEKPGNIQTILTSDDKFVSQPSPVAPPIIPITRSSILFKVYVKDMTPEQKSITTSLFLDAKKTFNDYVLKYDSTTIDFITVGNQIDANLKLLYVNSEYELGVAVGNVYKSHRCKINLTLTEDTQYETILRTFIHEIFHLLGIQHEEGTIMSPSSGIKWTLSDIRPHIFNECPTPNFRRFECSTPSISEFKLTNAKKLYTIPNIGYVYLHRNDKHIITNMFKQTPASYHIGEIRYSYGRDVKESEKETLNVKDFSVFPYNTNRLFVLFYKGENRMCSVRLTNTEYTCDFKIGSRISGHFQLLNYLTHHPHAHIILNSSVSNVINVYAIESPSLLSYKNYTHSILNSLSSLVTFTLYRSISRALEMNNGAEKWIEDDNKIKFESIVHHRHPYDSKSLYCIQLIYVEYNGEKGYMNLGPIISNGFFRVDLGRHISDYFMCIGGMIQYLFKMVR